MENEVPEEPVFFIKPNSSLSDVLIEPFHNCRYEGELSFIIKSGNILGVAFGLDLTLTDIQKSLAKKGLPWEKSKAFDKSALFSKFVKIDRDIAGLRLELFINGELRQKGGIELMINKPSALLKIMEEFFKPEDYDIIMTGTPKGVGPVKKGDKYTGKIFDKNTLLVEESWIVQ